MFLVTPWIFCLSLSSLILCCVVLPGEYDHNERSQLQSSDSDNDIDRDYSHFNAEKLGSRMSFRGDYNRGGRDRSRERERERPNHYGGGGGGGEWLISHTFIYLFVLRSVSIRPLS